MKLAIGLLSLAIIVFCSTSNATAVDPGADWEILETAHFQIVFDSKHYPLALRYAYASEKAYVASKPFFSFYPKKTVVVINDTTDLANGFATGLPYPLIVAFPVLPTPHESIDDYGNWESELMTHEYAHILQFEPATGLARPLRWLFGNIVRPNMLLPRWYLEGQAVYLESQLSNFGRMRSQTAMAVPRALAEEGSLVREDISRLNEISIPDAVDGLRPYILGSLLWSEVAIRGGDDTIRLLNEDHSRRMPFFINAPPKRRLGLDYQQLLNEAYTRVIVRATAQLEQINKAGKFNSVPLPEQDGIAYRSPVVSPDGKQLVFISQAHNTDERVEWVQRPEVSGSFGQVKRKILFGGISINRASWLPDSSGLVFDKIDSIEYYYSYSDLYKYDFASKKVSRLTKKMRAREPVVARDGSKIVFVQVVPGGTRLAQVDIAGQNPIVIYEPAGPNLRISGPEFFSDNEIVFVEKPLNGAEQLKVVNLETKEVRTVLDTFKPAASPRMSAHGLLFTSGVSGLDNVYLANGDLSSARAVTNVSTRALTPEVDLLTNELYFSRLQVSGTRLHIANQIDWMDAAIIPPTVESLAENKFPQVEEDIPEVEVDRRPYRVLPYMVPRYWLPFVYFFPGGTYFSAGTGSSDPVGEHSYGLQTSYDSLSKAASFAGTYVNSSIRNLSITTSAASTSQYVFSADVNRRVNTGMIAGQFPLTLSSSKWFGELGTRFQEFELSGRKDSGLGAFAGILYKDVSQRGYQISPEKGGNFSLEHTYLFPHVGTLQYEITDFASAYYFSKWLPKRHAFATFFNATYAPRLRNTLYGRTTSAAVYSDPILANDMVMRGYPSGAFLGRTLLNANVEYRFPISYPYRGWGTKPIFTQRVHGALFGDVITADGFAYDSDRKSYFRTRTNHAFVGYGAEARVDLTMFYYLPVRFTFGIYNGADSRAGLGWYPFMGFSL